MAEVVSVNNFGIDRYHPNQPLGRPLPGTCIGGQNVIFEDGDSRVYRGSLDTGENNIGDELVALTSFINDRVNFNITLAALQVIFTPYHHILIEGRLYLIVKLVSTEATTSALIVDPPRRDPAPVVTPQVRRVPNLFALTRDGRQRASQYAGNAAKYRDEAIFVVGRGPLRLNGDATTVPVTATDAPQVAYPNTSGGYDVRPAGFTTPPAPTLAAIAGGTKQMPAGEVSVKITYKRQGFSGRGLASPPSYVTVAANGRFTVTHPGALPTATDGTNAIEVWVTKRNDAHRGPWHLQSEYLGVGPHTVEFLDEELTEELEDDNDPPPPCLFVAYFNDLLLYISFGDSPTSVMAYAAGGSGIAVAKASNPEAASPAAFSFITPTDVINGVHIGKRFIYFLSPGFLNVGQRSGNDESPLLVFSYGQSGFAHQYSAVVVNDVLYGLTGNGLIRTTDGGDIDDTFSLPVKDDLARIENARAFLGYDPQGKMLVIFENNATATVKAQVRAHSVNLDREPPTWNTPCVLGDGTTADFIVTGCATVGERLYFVTSAGDCYEWDNSGTAPPTVSGFLATNFDTGGAARTNKTLRAVKVNGGINGTMRVFRNLALSAMLNNDTLGGSETRTLTNVVGGAPKHHPVWRLNWTGYSFALRFDFTMQGGLHLLDTIETELYSRDGLTE